MAKAVFLDRDGVLNRLVWNPATSEYESPHQARDLELFPWTIESLLRLQHLGYLLFLISNQPSYAKGKTSMENIKAIHEALHRTLDSSGVVFADYFYCYHHPNGIVPELTGTCLCRKPGTLFLSSAAERFGFSCDDSWLIGDQDSDIQCGLSFGLRTIQINEPHSHKKRGRGKPEFTANNLQDASLIIQGIVAENAKGGRGIN